MVDGTQPVGVARQMSGPGDHVVRDSAGHVIARINTLGLVLMGMLATTDLDSGEYVIKDCLGFVMLRVNPDGVWHMGQRVDGLSEADLLDIQPAVELARTAIRRVGPRDMPSWRRARALAVQGRGHARFACIGDSNTMGGWALGVGEHRRALSVPALLAPMLHPALGATSENYIGRALSATSGYSTYDPRVTVGAGWTATGAASAGGESWVNTTTTNAMQFEPSAPWQRADVWVKLTAAAELSIGVAGSMQTFTPAVGSVVRLSYEAPSLVGQSLQIIRVSGSATVIGWDCFADDLRGVSLINMGRSGWRSDQYAPVIDDVVAMAPDAAYVQLGLNDFNQNINPADFADNLDVILDALSGAGIDAAIVVSFQPGSSKPWPWSDYVAVMDAAARSRGLPLIDIGERFGPYAEAMADGLVTNNLHPNSVGYGDTAVLISNYLNL